MLSIGPTFLWGSMKLFPSLSLYIVIELSDQLVVNLSMASRQQGSIRNPVFEVVTASVLVFLRGLKLESHIVNTGFPDA